MVGSFRVTIEIGDAQGERFERAEALVNTEAAFTWVPRPVLERLGVLPEENAEFILADGRRVFYDVATALVRIDGRLKPTQVGFGDPGSEPLLGVVTLGEFRLGVDAVNQRLVPTPGLLKRSD